MWCSDRRRFLTICAAGAVSACGFTPIYGTDGPARAAFGRIAVTEIDGLMGFELRERLIERFGAASAASHRLDVAIEVESNGLAITTDAEITRYNLTGQAAFSLVKLAEGQVVLKDNIRAFAAYSATASVVATRSAERDARIRLATALADQITLRIAAEKDIWSS